MATNQVVVMPYPARGHLNPFMSLCDLLSSRSDGTTIFTVVVTEEWLGLIGSDPKPDNVRFATIPNVIPSEHGRGSDMVGFFTAVQTKMESPFEEVLNQLELPVKLIIGDAFLSWIFDVADRRNIPVATYWAMSASMFTMWYHVDLLEQHRHIFVDLSERGEELIDYIPGLSPTKVADMSPVTREQLRLSPNLISMMKRAQSLILPTVYELEHEAVDALRSELQKPIYTFGPNIRHHQLRSNKSAYMTWLDSKPPKSVLYICLGSFLSVSTSQMDEIAAGLKQSGVTFLWIAKGENSWLKEKFGEKGLVVEWCDQLSVLLHSSVGGFWSHCGWNSVKESVYSGVPMLSFPIFADQPLNSKVVVNDWRNGWKMRKEMHTSNLVKRGEIAETVKRFMDFESVERREMMKRVKNLQTVCRQSIEEGGSAIKDVGVFIGNNVV
ncbi:hypothetical protein L2E82_20250 [Cichorium intybus]|uniref:Uncharacterized protein n=1 Tax=Cichorium intybus TaxID=13427 RepID=A0ACB9DT81_CICIN|nr:hypothetical protein L2E82_20250 [Cichorium intybus]